MRRNGISEEESFDELDHIRDLLGFELLMQHAVKIQGAYRVEVFVERLAGKTQLVHVAGRKKNVERYLEHLHRLTQLAPVQWIRVNHNGFLGRRRVREMAAERRVDLHDTIFNR